MKNRMNQICHGEICAATRNQKKKLGSSSQRLYNWNEIYFSKIEDFFRVAVSFFKNAKQKQRSNEHSIENDIICTQEKQ